LQNLNKTNKNLLLLLGAIFFYKLAVNAFFMFVFDINSGSMDYEYLAQNILSGNGFVLEAGGAPNLWRPPLYPYFLTGLYGVFGQNHLPVVVVQVLFDILSGLLFFFIGRTIFDEKTAFGGVLVWGLYPFSTYYTARIMTESLFTLLLALLIYLLLKAKTKLSVSGSFLLGIVQGFSCLCKASMIYSTPLIIAYLWFVRKVDNKEKLKNLSLVIVGAAMVISPWTIRNYQVSNKFILISSPGSYAFWSGNFILTDGLDDDELNEDQLSLLEEARKKIAKKNDDFMAVENSDFFLKATIANIKHQPVEFVELLFKKVFRFWFSTFHSKTKQFQLWVTMLQLSIIIPGLYGLYQAVKDNKDIVPTLMFIAYLFFGHVLTSSTLRYSIPIMPYIILFAAYGLVRKR